MFLAGPIINRREEKKGAKKEQINFIEKLESARKKRLLLRERVTLFFIKYKSMILEKFKKEQFFLYGIAAISMIVAFIYQTPEIAMWVGFALAGYSAIANDSIQTLGTFLTTNSKRSWWLLWLFVGGILVATNVYGFMSSNGSIHFDRLNSIPQPTSFAYLQLLSPIILIILTRFKMPVSTSFLLLSTFSNAKTIQGMLTKTFMGYAIAFVVAFIVWSLIAHWSKQFFVNSDKEVKPYWYVLQWLATGFLWSQWLMHDTANIAVFIPRTITTTQFIGIIIFLFAVIGYLMYKRGDKIQEIVKEKKDINNVRSATIIDFVYSLILLYFKQLNHLPMSTTWVFLGLLAGRELALTESSKNGDALPFKRSLKLVGKDIIRAAIGLAISLALAILINKNL